LHRDLSGLIGGEQRLSSAWTELVGGNLPQPIDRPAGEMYLSSSLTDMGMFTTTAADGPAATAGGLFSDGKR
jgi:hypothetical protein